MIQSFPVLREINLTLTAAIIAWKVAEDAARQRKAMQNDGDQYQSVNAVSNQGLNEVVVLCL